MLGKNRATKNAPTFKKKSITYVIMIVGKNVCFENWT